MSTTWKRYFRDLFFPSGRTRQPQRLHLEVLEDRTTPTTLVSITGNPPLITDAIAPGTFTLSVVFSGAMNTAIAPTISFPTSGENPGAALAFANGHFAATSRADDTYIANFNVADTNLVMPNIDVQVAGARDFSNALVSTQTVANTFSIDTLDPVVQSFAVNKPVITAADANTNFIVTVTYHEAMQTTLTVSNTPVIAFSQNLNSILTFTSSSWNAGGTVYTATYKINSSSVTIPSININVTGAKNVAGAAQLSYTAANALTISTASNPNTGFPVGSLARVVGDFNGDTLTDVAAFYSNGKWLVSLSTGTSFLAPTVWSAFRSGIGFTKQLVADFNNDGMDDIANYYAKTNSWGVSVSNGSAFVTTTWAANAKLGAKGWTQQILGDFNNDGRMDIAGFQNPSGVARWYVSLSTGTKFNTVLWANFNGLALSGWTKAVAGDFNGDGKTDIANFFNRSGLASWWVSTSNGAKFTTTYFGAMPTYSGWTNQMAGDFDHDGKFDLVSYNSATQDWWVSLSSGTTFTTTQWLALSPAGGFAQVVADFNHDNKDDLGLIDFTTGQIVVGTSNGTGFSSSIWNVLSSTAGLVDELVGDFNGDGKPDLALFFTNNSTTQWWVSKNNGSNFTTTQWL